MAGNQASATVTPVAPTSAGAIPTLVRYTGPAVPIPDGTGSASASVTIGNIGTVRGVDLEVGCSTSGGVTTPGITHPYRSDLVGTLRSPAGTTITLFSHVGSDGDGLCRTWFTDAAGPSITSVVDEANLPWTFPYRPVDPMATFAGEDAQGMDVHHRRRGPGPSATADRSRSTASACGSAPRPPRRPPRPPRRTPSSPPTAAPSTSPSRARSPTTATPRATP
ncbi:MAG: hypothetical protein U0P45_05665 [Acidimicrobiales bacterium]